MQPEERILKKGEENIQLKDITYNEISKRWYLAFLRNRVDTPFITKLNDNTDTAESLEEDEFIGQECCCIYDEETNILSLQNNKNSISYGGANSFLNEYCLNEKIYLSAITYKDKYNEISLEDGIKYKSIIIGYTDISRLIQIDADENTKQIINPLMDLSNNLSSINGKIELNVGRTKNFLSSENLQKIVNVFKKNPTVTTNLKVKMLDHDTIRLIDLLHNTVHDDGQINITKDDPKTFNKILHIMDDSFDVFKEEVFNKCKRIY